MTRPMAALLLVLLLAPASAAEPWREDLPAALDEAAAGKRPLVLMVGSAGCAWCTRLRDESAADPAARRALAETVAVEVRAERHPGLVAALGIESFPTLVLVNRKGLITRLVRGYLPAADLATTVRVLVLHGDEITGQTLPALAQSAQGLDGNLDALGGGDPRRREQARAWLAAHPEARERLWGLLDHRHLAVRIDAAAVLSALTGRDGGYDPFADADIRHARAAAWRQQVTGALPEVP